MAYDLIGQLHDLGYAVLPRLTEKASAVLQKPFNGPELLSAFRRALSV
ncbi:MAG TPA: hypothetical protein VG758_22845 [Hyphomicrobiaceae bacterium]|jgi:hypothetical protein|nr:hypothetical protein [Hyphomicrobiaceae bacterium]